MSIVKPIMPERGLGKASIVFYERHVDKLKFDRDALTFLRAVKNNDLVSKPKAIDRLVKGLKMINAWETTHAFWPFYGASAESHKYNLFNPADSDSAFRLLFVNSPVHSTNGILFNGISQYCRTFYNPFLHGAVNNASMGVYSRSNRNMGAAISFGCGDSGNVNRMQLALMQNPTASFVTYNNTGRVTLAVTDSFGLYIGSRTASNYIALHKQGTRINFGTASGGTSPNTELFLGANNANGTPNSYDGRQHAIAFVMSGKSDKQCRDLFTIIQQYQNELGRLI